MTISAPNFTRLQTGVPNADDLRVRGPVNVALAYLGGSLVTQLNTQFGAISNSISAALVTFLATSNTWTALQVISVSGAGALTLVRNDGGATPGPILTLFRNSASPAANDLGGTVDYAFKDAAGNTDTLCRLMAMLIDPGSTSEDSEMQIHTTIAGTLAQRVRVGNGVQIGSPTGGYQGDGTLNLDNALFRDGTQVVSSRVTGYGDPFGGVSRATFSITTVTTASLAAFVAAVYTDLKAHGLIGT